MLPLPSMTGLFIEFGTMIPPGTLGASLVPLATTTFSQTGGTAKAIVVRVAEIDAATSVKFVRIGMGSLKYGGTIKNHYD